MKFHTLKVIAINKPIDEATTITFDVPSVLYDSFNYSPGQYLTIKFKIDGQEVRRSYSLNSSPFKEEALQVTVKRVKNGLVSNFVGDHLKVGDELEVMVPQGKFYADIQPNAYKTYFLFAAGSGITPIISIAKSVLLASPKSAVNLFFGNTNQDTIIFKDEIEALEKSYNTRFKVVHTLSKPRVWSTWKQWEGKKGRIDENAVEWFITNHPPVAQTTEYYICGPGAMNKAIRKSLLELGIPKELIHIEQFGGEVTAESNDINAISGAQLTVKINNQNHQLPIPTGKTILQTLKDANIETPYSCESGVCGTCVAKIKSGSAEMKSCMALDENEIKDGFILTCQSLPTSADLEIEYS